MGFPANLQQIIQHRCLPLPQSPWVARQLWDNVLFYNVPVSSSQLALTLPQGMVVDEYQGQAWVSIVPFQLCMSPRGLPSPYWPIRFNEINVRTYVTVNGLPGVYFYSLDANDALAVWAARGLFNLNYFNAQIAMLVGDDVTVQAKRTHKGMPASVFSATYGPAGQVEYPQKGSLADWLTSRWCFFCPKGNGSFIRGDIHHEPWPLQPAHVAVSQETLLEGHGLPQPQGGSVSYFSKRVHVLTWPRSTVYSL